jgi:hypothetical protein
MSAQGALSVNATRLEQAVAAALSVELASPAAHSLSFDLYSASAFQPSTDARFVMLVTSKHFLIPSRVLRRHGGTWST